MSRPGEDALPEGWDLLSQADALALAPPDGAKERVRLRLAASLGLAAGLGAAAGAATAGAGGASSLPAEGLLAVGKALLLKQAVVVGVVTATALTGGSAVYVQVRAHRQAAAQQTLAAKVHPAPAPAQLLPQPAPVPVAPEIPVPPPTPETLGDERALLDGARLALVHRRTADAQALLLRHAKLFPAGRLAEEREALSIRVLVLQGRLSEARLRARRFKVEHPGSIQQPGIDQALRSGRH
jgi:hypothetical protein